MEVKKLTVREAIREAIADEIVRDEKVFLMGEVCRHSLSIVALCLVVVLTARKWRSTRARTRSRRASTIDSEPAA